MQAVILMGLPGAGKTSFFKDRFFRTHVRISLDMLKTRRREQMIMQACLASKQRFVIDNTSPTSLTRSHFISAARASGFQVTGYYFHSKVEDCLRRNALRADTERVPDVAVLSIAQELERPRLDEGFDQLFHVSLSEAGFIVEAWRDDL